jgi:hypothetical protein
LVAIEPGVTSRTVSLLPNEEEQQRPPVSVRTGAQTDPRNLARCFFLSRIFVEDQMLPTTPPELSETFSATQTPLGMRVSHAYPKYLSVR